jgi:adenosylmethionine-8-amino-7-oxononanoate aminotransferase
MSVGRVPAFTSRISRCCSRCTTRRRLTSTGSDTPDDPEAVKQKCLAALEAILREHGRRIAADRIEPIVQGAAGMIVQPDGVPARGAPAGALEYDVLLIADEVATVSAARADVRLRARGRVSPT